jgi:hypothetical protein
LFPKKLPLSELHAPFFWLPSGEEDGPPKRQFCYWWAKNVCVFFFNKFEIDATRSIN